MYVVTWEVLQYGLEGFDFERYGHCECESLDEVKSQILYEIKQCSGSQQIGNVHIYKVSQTIPCSTKIVTTFEIGS